MTGNLAIGIQNCGVNGFSLFCGIHGVIMIKPNSPTSPFFEGVQMMNILAKLFDKTPKALDIRLQLKQIERDQWRKRREVDDLVQTKQAKVEQAVAAKKAGKQELVQDIFRDMRQIEIDYGHANSDLRRLSLTKTALTAFLRKVEIIEKNKDHKSLQNLLRRYNSSAIQKTIDLAEVDDDAFGSMLQEVLGEEEVSAAQEQVHEDAGFAEFDRAIEEMAQTGDTDNREPPRTMAGFHARSQSGGTLKPLSADEEDEINEAELKQAIQEAEKVIQDLDKEIAEIKSQLAELRAHSAQIKSQKSQKTEEMLEKQRELDALIASGESNLAMCEFLRALGASMMETIKEFEQEEEKTDRKADELEGLISRKEQELSAKRQQLAYLQSRIA
jgi:hypothetical protein